MNDRFLKFLRFCCCVLLVPAGLYAQQTTSPAQTPSRQASGEQNAGPKAAASPDGDAALPPTNDPKEIVRRSVEIDHRNWKKIRNYTWQQREVVKQLDKHGKVKSTDIKTFDINYYYGEQYSQLIAINDKPLSAKEQKKEDERLDKFLAKYRKESAEDRQKRLAKEEKQREQSRAFLRDVVNAYDFRIVGNDTVDGHETWVIETTPRKDFHPTQPHADILPKIKAKLWIDKKGYNWVKVEAEATDTISFGLFLVRIHPGSRFSFEQERLNNEVWLLRRLKISGSARVALLKNAALDQEDTFSNYRKFVTSVKILPSVKEVPAEKPQQ